MARIVLSDDHLNARLVLGEGEVLTLEQVEQLLMSTGVSFGVMRPVLTAQPEFRGPLDLIVAMGEPPIPGRPAAIELMFRDEEQDWTRLIESGGKFDVWTLGPVRPVAPGTVLVYRNAPLPPRAGQTVLNRLAQPPFPEDVLLRAGEGARVEDGGAAVVATIAGTPYVEEGIFLVRPRHLTRDNVTLESGELSVPGDVTIEGHVLLGGVVRAAGNVTIEGGVIGGRVYAGGSIKVRGEIRNGAHIEADRHVLARSIESSTIRCKGHVVIQEGMLYCDIEAYGEAVANGGVVGGKVRAGARGVTTILGSSGHIVTQVAVLSPVDQSQFTAIEGELSKIRATLRNLQPRVREAQVAIAGGEAEHPAQLVELRKVIDLWTLLAHRERALLARKKALGVPLQNRRTRLDVLDRAYPGVNIQLGGASVVLDRTYPAGTFVDVNGSLAFKAIG